MQSQKLCVNKMPGYGRLKQRPLLGPPNAIFETLGMGTEPRYICMGGQHDTTRPSISTICSSQIINVPQYAYILYVIHCVCMTK